MYVSKKHQVGKRAGLKNKGYFDLEDDYEDFEGLILSDIHAGPGKMKETRGERIKERIFEFKMG